MPRGLVRYQRSTGLHFLTFSCYQRHPWLASSNGYSVFEQELEQVRQKCGLLVAGYVLMPEHVHLLVAVQPKAPLSLAMQVLKQRSSRRLKAPEQAQFWQRRYYDFNVWSHAKVIEKLRYMHRNPVTRGLVETPAQWPWSSFRHHATGDGGTVEIESEWTAKSRDLQKEDS